MGAIKNAKREFTQKVKILAEKNIQDVKLIEEAGIILRGQAAQIVAEIKNKRDKRYCLAKISCKVKNKQLPFSELRGHHIEDIDQFIDGFMESYFEDHDIFNAKDRQKFLDEVEDYGEKKLNQPDNLITVCHDCHTMIHRDVNSHIVGLKRIAWKQTSSWDNQKKIQDFFPENKKISTELSETKEKLNRINIEIDAKEKIIEILSTDKKSNDRTVQNLRDDLETLRDACRVLTDEVENYRTRLTEKSRELIAIKKQLITSLQCTMLEPEFDNKREKNEGVEDLEQEQREILRESIIPNDKETPEKPPSLINAYRLSTILNFGEEVSPIAKEKIRNLYPILNKLESKKRTKIYYSNSDRGYKIYNKKKNEFMHILIKPLVKYIEDLGLTLYSKEDCFDYGRRVEKNKRFGRLQTFEDLELTIERAYDFAVQDNFISQITLIG